MDKSKLRTLKDKAWQIFNNFGEVVAVGLTKIDGVEAIAINFKEQPVGNLPTDVDGVPVKVKVTGPIYALSNRE